MYSTPLAYLLTWSTYGCRLHHDNRGSVDLDHNSYGAALLQPDEFYAKLARDRMSHDAYRLTPPAREVVGSMIAERVQFRRWRLLAVNPLTEHVHVVVQATDVHPDEVVKKLKARCTHMLREADLAELDAPVWADRGGSTRYLFTEKSLSDACNYVVNCQ